MNNVPKKYQDLLDQFPFLTLVKYGGNEYVGIIQNKDNNLVSMYNYESIKDVEDRMQFLEIGEEWWWGTNRMIPINIIFKNDFEKYRTSLITFSIKDFDILHGPCISLSDIMQKRIKRRNIQLIRKI